MLTNIILFIKGLLIGIADLIPGVSGGTIALIVGIYPKLIQAIAHLHPRQILLLLRRQFKVFAQETNLFFLLILVAGILTSVKSLAHIVSYLIDEHPLILWGFFFGLVLGSIFLLARQLGKLNISVLLSFVASTLMVYLLLNFLHLSLTPSYFTTFISGILAICAMILPGISGSFILLMLGMYDFIIEAIKNLDWAIIAIYATAALLGLLLFTRLLQRLLTSHPRIFMSCIIGIMTGSISKLWPWQIEQLQLDIVTTVKLSVLPSTYSMITGQDSQVVPVMMAFFIGIFILIVLHCASKYYTHTEK